MTIQAIGKTSYLIVVSEKELSQNHLSVDEFSKADAEKLYHTVMPKPLQNCPKVCLEVYAGKDELMIFVRFGGKDITAVTFEDFEDLLAGVRFCPEMSDSELFYDGKQYILVLSPWDGDPVPESIFEFGERLDIQAEYIPWLREHCVSIISGKAIETLVSVF